MKAHSQRHGPWGLGDRDFPLAVHHLQADGYQTQHRFIQKEAAKWKEVAGHRISGDGGNFPQQTQPSQLHCKQHYDVCSSAARLEIISGAGVGIVQ